MALSYDERYRREKETLNVLILGPYGDCRPTLINLRAYLRRNGYKNTNLVEDLPDIEDIPEEGRDVYFLAKSQHYIENWADILLFILLAECNCDSVLAELYFTIAEINEKCNYASILHSEDRNIGRLVRGDLEVHRISSTSFVEQHQLKKLALAACFKSERRLAFAQRRAREV